MQQSTVMTNFCRDYTHWFNKGTPSHEIFSTRNGLCRMWMDYLLNNDSVDNGSVCSKYSELKEIFKSEDLDHMFPFNESHSDFINEMLSNKSHLNQKRIKWIMDHSLWESKND